MVLDGLSRQGNHNMSNPWYTIFGPQDWDGVLINTGNKKIDGKYYNVIGDRHVQLSASGVMWLVGGSGIQLISKGFVDVSGLRVKNLQYEDTQKIDYTGGYISAYPGINGGLIYKSGDNDLATIPSNITNVIVYNSNISSVTMPNAGYGPLYISSGNNNSHELKSYDGIEYTEPDVDAPSRVIIKNLTEFTSGIQIAPYYEAYKGSVLTHMGSGMPAEWQAAPYLKADGVLWNRFPKRPIKIEDGKILFYATKPKWAQDWVNSPDLTILEKEFGKGFDTIAIVRNDTREVAYIKLAAEIRYGADNTEPDVLTPLEELFEIAPNINDPEDPTKSPNNGFMAKFCTPIPWDQEEPYEGNGYAFSVTKGAYMDMQLGRDATEKFSCIQEDIETSPYRFKPSTLNSISIRPNIHTAFNMLGENIDFVIYGQHKTIYNNYDPNIFGLDSTNLPSGMTPAFRVDANIANAVSGNPSSGVLFTKYLDRAKVHPTGYHFDTKGKILINTNSPYVINSIPSGTGLLGIIPVTGYISTYADVTINSTLYSENIIANNLYVHPAPATDNSGPYIANALLTIDRSGKIISRIPKTNPVVPGAPTNIVLDPTHTNGIGNSEISLSWSSPINDGNSDIINYIIQFSTNGGDSWTEIPNNLYTINRATPTSKYATIIGLSPLTSYQFRVAAQNGVGVGAFSEPSDSIMAGSSVPKSPYHLVQFREFDNTDFSDIILSWEDSQGGAANILGYTIEESSDGGNTWYYYNLPTELIADTSERISGTDSQTDYYYRVSSWNSYGQSAFSYVYSSGNYVPDPVLLEDQQNSDTLSNWDFGSVLFTGVCPT